MKFRNILVLTLLLSIALCGEAAAHARMLKSNPEKGASLSKAPAQVDLWFNELLEPGFNTVEIYPVKEIDAEKHGNLVKQKPEVDPKDKTHLSVKIDPLPPGEYALEWRVLSRDGHSAPGRLTFKIEPK